MNIYHIFLPRHFGQIQVEIFEDTLFASGVHLKNECSLKDELAVLVVHCEIILTVHVVLK